MFDIRRDHVAGDPSLDIARQLPYLNNKPLLGLSLKVHPYKVSSCCLLLSAAQYTGR